MEFNTLPPKKRRRINIFEYQPIYNYPHFVFDANTVNDYGFGFSNCDYMAVKNNNK